MTETIDAPDKQPLVLIVEDEDHVASFISQSLSEADFRVERARDVASGGRAWDSTTPSLVILDLTLPDGDGGDLLEDRRRNGDLTPVLVLSARATMAERVLGLDRGADDYLGKPFGIEELLARIRVLLRRAQPAQILRLGDLIIDFLSRKVTRGDRKVFLSETEYRLLEILAHRAGEPVSKRELLDQVWDDAERDDNVVEVYVSYLRNKLEWRGAKRLLQTVRGRGYMLSEQRDVP